MNQRKILKKKWKQKWKRQINAQKHKDYLIGRCKGSTSKEFKQFVKDFLCRPEEKDSVSPSSAAPIGFV